VDALVLAGEVEAPVGVEVAVADQGAELEDGFGSGQPSAGAGDVEAAADQVAAGPFDHSGRDRPAGREGAIVAQERRVAGQVADGRVRAAALIVCHGTPAAANDSRTNKEPRTIA